MRILLDTNIVLDILLSREPFLNDSLQTIKKSIINGDKLFLSASSATDIYYIIKKQKGPILAIDGIKKLSEILSFADVNEECILKAANSDITDFEDAVIDCVALHINADIIITRNTCDFLGAKTKFCSPSDFVSGKYIEL